MRTAQHQQMRSTNYRLVVTPAVRQLMLVAAAAAAAIGDVAPY